MLNRTSRSLGWFRCQQNKKTKRTKNTENKKDYSNNNKINGKKLRIFLPLLLPLLFFLANAPASDKKDLLSELDLMKKLKPHPHVIRLLGCVTETGKGCVKGITVQFLQIYGIKVFLVMIILPMIRMIERFHQYGQKLSVHVYWNKSKRFAYQKYSIILTELGWYTNVAAVPLFGNTNTFSVVYATWNNLIGGKY